MSEKYVMTMDRNEFFLKKKMKRFIVKYHEKRPGWWQKNENGGGKPRIIAKENVLLSLSEW